MVDEWGNLANREGVFLPFFVINIYISLIYKHIIQNNLHMDVLCYI